MEPAEHVRRDPLIEFAPNGDVVATPALDAWRANYMAGTASLDDHRRLYEQIVVEYPNQNYYAGPLVADFLAWCGATSVVEIGGWDGALARDTLPQFPNVTRWDNYEIVNVPQVCDDDRYGFHVPDVFVWETELKADAFVASHVLEHLTVGDLLKLIDSLIDVDYAYVDVPLPVQPFDWHGTTTTHALLYSIGQFDEAWRRDGWTIATSIFRDAEVPSYVRFMKREEVVGPKPDAPVADVEAASSPRTFDLGNGGQP